MKTPKLLCYSNWNSPLRLLSTACVLRGDVEFDNGLENLIKKDTGE